MNASQANRIVVLLAMLVSCVGCDQVTKTIATRELAARHEPQEFLGGIFSLHFARNPGAFLGMGGDLPGPVRFWAMTVFNALAMGAIGIVLWKKWNMAPTKFAAGALILGGGIGNLIDRVSYGGLVTDFLHLRLGPLQTGIFNVADVAITAGCAILVVVFWRDDRAAKVHSELRETRAAP